MTRDGLAALKVLVERGPTRLNRENPGVAHCIAQGYVQVDAHGVARITDLGKIEHEKTKTPVNGASDQSGRPAIDDGYDHGFTS